MWKGEQRKYYSTPCKSTDRGGPQEEDKDKKDKSKKDAQKIECLMRQKSG